MILHVNMLHFLEHTAGESGGGRYAHNMEKKQLHKHSINHGIEGYGPVTCKWVQNTIDDRLIVGT